MFSADLESAVENDHLNDALAYDYSAELLDCKTSVRSIAYIVQWYEWVDGKYAYHSELLDSQGASQALFFDVCCKRDNLRPLPFRLVGIDPR